MTNPTCPELWRDELTRDDRTYACTRPHGHDGPHRNQRAHIMWGGPMAWFGDQIELNMRREGTWPGTDDAA